ncbi:adenylate/guanylate cyclase domain-containing protein [bacterium SCSIO 12696]|nr:adenylate/guanylate cyclase domain-containing protein [bacterium SCSIO 12696]
MTTTSDTKFSSGNHHQNIFRVLLGLSAVCHLLLLPKLFNGLAFSLVAIGVLLYILIAHFISGVVKEEKRNLCNHLLNYLDAILIGVFVSYSDFSLLPGGLFALLTLHNSAIVGGAVRMLESFISLLIGAALLLIVQPAGFSPEVDLGTAIASLVTLGAYLCIYGSYSHYESRHLKRHLKTTEQQLLQNKLRSYKLSKYLSPALRKEILSGKEVRLETQRKKLTVFFSDIRGFSELAEEMEPEALTGLLNNYLTEMSDIAIKFGGTIDKFMGDGMMVFFGDPSTRGAKDDCLACVSMAIAMKKHMRELQLRWANQGIQKPMEIRMGINTGFCTVGNFGTENRLDYTLLGTEVNLASRLESSAQPGEILVSHATYALVKDTVMCQDKGEITVKGYQQPVKVYSAIDTRKNLGKDQAYFEHATDGFSMYMDTDKINNYEKSRVLKSLKEAIDRLENEGL